MSGRIEPDRKMVGEVGFDRNHYGFVGGSPVSFYVESIVLFGPSGETRTVSLERGFNVIAGEQRTGKSSLLDIIDYCLGSGECNVAHGIIRRTVDWYGLKLVGPQGEAFVARKGPEAGQKSRGEVYFEVGQTVEVPQPGELRQTQNVEALVGLLSEFAGIPENTIETPSRSSRPSYAATIRHALFFVLQEQDEISDRKFLFHKQGEPGVPFAIVDVLPFFLGAMSADHLRKRNELRRVREKERELRAEVSGLRATRDSALGEARALQVEAADAGLLGPEAPDDPFDALAEALSVRSGTGDVPEADIGVLNGLFDEQRELLAKRRRLVDDIAAVHELLSQERGYVGERREQHARLASIRLITPEVDAPDTCPVCGGVLEETAPGFVDVREALKSLSEQLATLESPNHGVEELLDRLRRDMDALNGELASVKERIFAVRRSNERMRELQAQSERWAWVQGRITQFLDGRSVAEDLSSRETRLGELQRRISELESQTSDETLEEATTRIVGLVSRDITELARRLEAEHSEFLIRLDERKLTVVAETPTESIPLYRMGSGGNRVNYHIAAYLALQKWFAGQSRPVPRFVFFDQPSQAFFPPELPDGVYDELLDADRAAVRRLIELISEQSAASGFQVILVEHAYIREPWFEDATRVRWYGGEKLIPADWDQSAAESDAESAVQGEEDAGTLPGVES